MERATLSGLMAGAGQASSSSRHGEGGEGGSADADVGDVSDSNNSGSRKNLLLNDLVMIVEEQHRIGE